MQKRMNLLWINHISSICTRFVLIINHCFWFYSLHVYQNTKANFAYCVIILAWLIWWEITSDHFSIFTYLKMSLKKGKILFLTQVFAFSYGTTDSSCFGLGNFINLSFLFRYLIPYWCRHQQWFLVHASLQGYRVDQEQEKFSCVGVILFWVLEIVRDPNVLCVKIK